jgi:hypothetical protein
LINLGPTIADPPSTTYVVAASAAEIESSRQLIRQLYYHYVAEKVLAETPTWTAVKRDVYCHWFEERLLKDFAFSVTPTDPSRMFEAFRTAAIESGFI